MSPMRSVNIQIRGTSLTVLLVSLLALSVYAQHSETPSKSAGGKASPFTGSSAAGSLSSASSDEVVLKVGKVQVTQSEIESVVSMRPSGGKPILNPEARRHMAEAYVRMLVLSQQALTDHLDATPELRS